MTIQVNNCKLLKKIDKRYTKIMTKELRIDARSNTPHGYERGKIKKLKKRWPDIELAKL